METFLSQLSKQFQLPLQNPVLVFALILVIILLAPILLKRLRVPGIIGLILAGILVGPYGLNLLARNEAIDLFSTIGILYLMFIAGLELEMKEFRRNSRRSIGFGALTFLVPILLGFPACFFILKYDFTASLLLSSMFSAHTMIAYPVVTKFGIARDEAVAITVGGTILTDTAVLLVLAVVTGSHNGEINSGFWLRIFISMAVFLLIMFYLVPFIAKWFFIRLEGEKTSHYVFVMAIVFLAAFLSQLAGMEPIIGAFVAGLVLNRLLPPSSVLMNRIQFVGNALFIPFFLISVGMLIDLRSLFHGNGVLLIAAVIIMVALAGKYLAARITQVLFGYTATQGLLIFGLSASRVAATMAVVLVGYKAGILDKSILEATILLILVSCLVAAIVTEFAAKRMVTASDQPEEPRVTKLSGRESILVPVANLINLEGLLEFVQYIRDKASMNPIRVLSVVNELGDSDSRLMKMRNSLNKIAESSAFPDSMIQTIVIADQNVPAGINRISRELDVQTIILGWPMKGTFTDLIFGHKTDHILETNDKCVMVCRIINPLIAYNRIILVSPPLSELEQGFDYQVRKVALLSQEIKKNIHLYANLKTRGRIATILSENKLNPGIRDFDIHEWDQVTPFLLKSQPDDIIFFFLGRKGSVSSHPNMDHLFERVATNCTTQMVVLVYAALSLGDDMYDKYRDFSSEPLSRSLETFERVQRGLGKMIHKAE